MEEQRKIEVAVFRYGVIQDFVNGIRLDHGERERLLREKCTRKWQIPYSFKSSISRGTIQRWIQLYESGGKRIESLYPKGRNDKGVVRVLDEEICLALLQLREEMPNATVPFILKTMQEREIVPVQPSQTTVYRFFHQHGLMKKTAKKEDRRKYEAEHPNDIWQSDVMHGPHLEVDEKKRKTYLIAFIDDHSRLIIYGRFYTSEGTWAFMHSLEQAFLNRGLPRKLYVDNGSAFRSRQLAHTTASLGIALIHSRVYKPQGRGKIERFNVKYEIMLSKPRQKHVIPGYSNDQLNIIIKDF